MPPVRLMAKKTAKSSQGGGISKYVILGGTLATWVLFFLLHVVTKMHFAEQASTSNPSLGGAPVLEHPRSKRPSPALRAAAAKHATLNHRLLGNAWAGLRTGGGANRSSGPFTNLPGAVGAVRFTYPDLIEEVDLDHYPPTEPLLDIVKRWNPDDSEHLPNPFHETLQVFNYSDPFERAVAEKYRNAEVPFKVYGVPDVEAVARKWTDEYLLQRMDSSKISYKIEESKDNHFMYWVNRGYKGTLGAFTPPTKNLHSIKFPEWLKIAHTADEVGIDAAEKHYYLMTGVQAGRLVHKNHRLSQFISADLPCFSTVDENFFVTAVDANKGIQCRFGMKGVIAEAHYDGGRNMVAMLKGAKRYVLAPPWACKGLSIVKEKAHPSYRHSLADWTNVAEAEADGFANTPGIDTIVHEGEVLYIPSFWFHYIQSLDFSIQCNTRSGAPPGNNNGDHIKACMSGAYAPDEAEKLKAKLNAGRESHAHESETRRAAVEGFALPEGDDEKEEEEGAEEPATA